MIDLDETYESRIGDRRYERIGDKITTFFWDGLEKDFCRGEITRFDSVEAAKNKMRSYYWYENEVNYEYDDESEEQE